MSDAPNWVRTTRYIGETGETKTLYQIAMLGVKEGAEILETNDGFLVDGDLFLPVETL